MRRGGRGGNDIQIPDTPRVVETIVPGKPGRKEGMASSSSFFSSSSYSRGGLVWSGLVRFLLCDVRDGRFPVLRFAS